MRPVDRFQVICCYWFRLSIISVLANGWQINSQTGTELHSVTTLSQANLISMIPVFPMLQHGAAVYAQRATTESTSKGQPDSQSVSSWNAAAVTKKRQSTGNFQRSNQMNAMSSAASRSSPYT